MGFLLRIPPPGDKDAPFLGVEGGHLSHEGLMTCTCRSSDSFPLKYLMCQAAIFGVACPEPRHGHGQVRLTALSFSSLLCTCRQGTWLDAGRNNCISHSQQHGCRSLRKDPRCCSSNLQVTGEDLGPVTPLLAPVLGMS